MKKKPVKNPALGVYEAACLLGVHWTRMRPMVESGVLVAHDLEVAGDKSIRVYSTSAVEANFEDYWHKYTLGQHTRRPRAHVDLREPMKKELAGLPQHIEFDDAIGVYTASEIMGVWPSFCARMAQSDKIVGRRLINHREGPSRHWIYSRKSCEENLAEARKLMEAGRHQGQPRSFL